MRNLLLPEQKKQIALEYRLRLAIVALAFAATLGVILFILLLPSYFVSSSKEKAVSGRYQAAQSSSAKKSDEEVFKTLSSAKGKLSLIQSIGTSVSVTEVLGKIVAYRTSDVRLTGFSIGAESNKARTVLITGVAKDRQALLSFSKKLEKEKTFSSIVLPVSNFERNKDIEFTINLNAAAPAASQNSQAVSGAGVN